LIESFSEAVAWARGEVDLPVREYQPPEKVEVEPIRRRLGLTQASFARVFGLNVATVRDWEQGRRTPEGPARTLLAVIARHPELVHEVLSARERRRASGATGSTPLGILAIEYPWLPSNLPSRCPKRPWPG
jgi:putative transcriptional regulator